MADLPQPPEPEGAPREAYRRQALEATLAEALRDALLTGRPAPSSAPDARPTAGHDKPDSTQPPRPAPSLIGSLRAAGTAGAPAASAKAPVGGGSTISRLVPPRNPSMPAGGQIGGAQPGGGITGGLSGIGSAPVGRLGSDGLEPDDVHAVIEMRRPSRKTSPAPSQAPDRKGASGSPLSGSPDTPATSSPRRDEIAAREESARRSSALSLIAPWSPDCDDILPGLTAKRPPKGPKNTAARGRAQPSSPGKTKKR
jgi:hypothetical protein